MADKTKIEWTDATWNPITGCSIVSPGCTNCYAMKLAGSRLKHIESRKGLTKDSKAGPVWTGEVRFNEKDLDQPLRWKRPRMIFVCAHGDLFAEGVPDEWIDKIFAVMALAPQHMFQVLTKRPERMRDYMARRFGEEASYTDLQFAAQFRVWIAMPKIDRLAVGRSYPTWPLPNVWLGVSVEDQKRADERIPFLLDTPAAIRWISAEPLLGPIDFYKTSGSMPAEGHPWRNRPILQGIHWIIVGGESGQGARPMHPDWARSIRDQCAEARVAFHFKQWGAWTSGENVPSSVHGRKPSAHWRADNWMIGSTNMSDPEDGWYNEPDVYRIGKRAAGRLLDGVNHDAFPQKIGVPT